MIIQIGDIYMDKEGVKRPIPNKTFNYFLPCLKEYGEEFVKRFNNVFKVAVGIGDLIVTRHGTMEYGKHLFVLLDTVIAPYHFISFLDWIRTKPMYETDYVFDNIQKTTFHMIVLKIPEEFYNDFELFKKGHYSKMFQDKNFRELLNSRPDALGVIIKDNNYKVNFIEQLNEWLGNTNPEDKKITPEEWDGEFDLPPMKETEIFNHHLI